MGGDSQPLLAAFGVVGLLGAALLLASWLRHTRRRRRYRRHAGGTPLLILTPHDRRAAPGPGADRAPPTPGQPDAQAPAPKNEGNPSATVGTPPRPPP
jgi:hypothetical protein